MPKFLAITSRGLIEPLAAELTDLKFKHVTPKPDGVVVDCSWSEVQRLHHETRLATRVLLPVADFTAYNEEDLYYGVLRKHDFTQYIDVGQTFRVEAKVREHAKLRDQRYVAMKVKDAVADQFRKKFNKRPNVGDEASAALRVVVRVVGPKVSLAVDLTGDSLSNRGYRVGAGEAPLRENVAAGLVRLSGWKPGQVMVDPFCGSGTILIEAALMAAGRAATVRSREYLLSRLKSFKMTQSASESEAGRVTKAAPSGVHAAIPSDPQLFGFDSDGGVIEKARRNAREAGIDKWIRFEKCDMKNVEAPAASGVIVTNPPYGERLEDTEKAKQLLSDFSAVLKTKFKGWDAWILSGNKDAIQGLRLKAARRVPVWNGPIECRFLHYRMY